MAEVAPQQTAVVSLAWFPKGTMAMPSGVLLEILIYLVAETRLLFKTPLIKSDLRFHVPDLWLLKHGTRRPLNLLPLVSDGQFLKGIPAQGGKNYVCLPSGGRGPKWGCTGTQDSEKTQKPSQPR